MKDLISIIIPAHNRGHLIAETLRSIQEQTHKNWECIIVDDDSKDTTAAVVLSFIQKDERFRYIKRPHTYKKGPSGTRNCGIDMAQGDFIQFCDDDDILHPANMTITLKSITNKYDFCWVGQESFYNDFHYQYDTDTCNDFESFSIGIDQLYEMISNEIPFGTCRVLWRKKIFNEVRFNEELHYAEDWEISQRLLSKGIKGVGIKKNLYYARKHGKSNTVEFWSGDPKRRSSKIAASKAIIDNLIVKGFFDKKFQRFFVQSAIFLKSRELLDYTLKKPEIMRSDRIKFANLYRYYPVISYLMRRKKQFRKLFKK